MKTLARILLGLLILLLVIVITCSIYIRLNGRQLVFDKLSEIFQRPVMMEDIHFLFPFGLRIMDFKIENMMQAQDVQLQIGIPDLLHKRFHLLFMSLSEPVVLVTRNEQSKFVLGDAAPAGQASQTPSADNPFIPRTSEAKTPPPRKMFSVVIDYLLVKKGEIQFADRANQSDFRVDLKDVDLKSQNVLIPTVEPMETKFDLTAAITNGQLPFSGSKVQAQGFINVYKKDMNVNINVIEPDGKVSCAANLYSLNNDMTVQGKVQIKNLTDKPETETNPASFKDVFFAALQSSGLEITSAFNFKTKMDDFQVGAISFSGQIGEQPSGESSGSTDYKNLGHQFEEFGKKFYKEKIEPSLKEQEDKPVPAQ